MRSALSGPESSLDIAPPDNLGVEGVAAALDRIAPVLDGVDRLGVAFSGGVDSSVLLAAAVRLLGADRVLAVLGVSASLASDERAAAHEVAAVIGAPLVEVMTEEAQRPLYRANGPDRCFHCKDELFTRMAEVAATHRLDAIAYGENADDARRPDRPGSLAATQHRVLRPLASAGLTKTEVRAMARAWDLPCADKPAAPCLASRIPHHSEVTPEKLQQIDQAESALRALGLTDFRVRHHGEVARLELSSPDLVRAVAEPLRTQLVSAVRAAGFRHVTLDLAGLQSGAFTLAALQIVQDTSNASRVGRSAEHSGSANAHSAHA
jgi:pyridinium-3,5-biscarboxylic acid mononucleotide sulfurtransferase